MDDAQGEEHVLPLLVGGMAPCTEAVYSGAGLMGMTHSSAREVPLGEKPGWLALSLSFTDRDGQDWARGRGFLKLAKDAKDAFPDLRQPDGAALALVSPEMKPMDECGSDK
ncbi:hypothetical protein ACR6C2_07870 [Streptomyces sp. INA 01156]